MFIGMGPLAEAWMFDPDAHPEPLRSEMKAKPGEFHCIYGVMCHKDDRAAIEAAQAQFAERRAARSTETLSAR